MNYESTLKTADAVDYADGVPDTAATDLSAREASAPGTLRRWAIPGGIVVALLLTASWFALRHGGATDAVAGGNAASQAQTVSVIAPGQTTVEGNINASGAIAARRDLPVGIAGEGGRVISVLVDAGTWVRQGQVLAVVDRSVQSQQIAGQAANVAVQDANARIAQSNLDRALKLVAKGFISNADVDRLTATRDAAVASVRVARASLGQLQASTARLNVVAPAAGLVLTRGVEPGQVVSGGSGVLFRIAKDGELEMQARLSEDNLARLAVGQSAEVTPVGSGRSFTGKIWQLSPTIDVQTREGVARIALDYDAALRPGGFASARIRSGAVTAPVLPESAILSDATGSYVFVLGQGNKVARRAVKIGDVTAQGIAIAAGLDGTERVVLRAGGFLNPGDTVRPVEQRASGPHGG
ncbi:efflux RND transporter periplasmic adaptor subunit [Novosphingobium sp.]|uniref:efflux RND transporter periplasmic adaptor subunit n=1 Tax=Novosphingobium sp. TaxID=1874826 RepID=UPI0038B6F71A